MKRRKSEGTRVPTAQLCRNLSEIPQTRPVLIDAEPLVYLRKLRKVSCVMKKWPTVSVVSLTALKTPVGGNNQRFAD